MSLPKCLGRMFRKEKSHSEPSSPTLSNREKKSLFGLKVVQAQQNPEPIYDISGCSAPNLHNDTFILCKILGKTSLIIKNNCLTSLESGGSLEELADLKVLDASYNKIEKLASNCYFLKKLKILNLCSNKLKCLPDSFTSLYCLEELYLSANKFSNVPVVLCALPKLRVLSLKDNNITVIPKELSGIHRTLNTLEIDSEKIINPSQDIIKDGLVEIMKHLCELNGIVYKSLVDISEDVTDNTYKAQNTQELSTSPPVDMIMVEYMRKKQEQLKHQISQEERMRALEKVQLENVLYNTSKSKEELLQELSCSPFEISDYEEKKQEKILDQMRMEENFRIEQDEQLNIYLTSTSNKESLLQDISAEDDSLQLEIEGIVNAKEIERSRLLQDLSKAERDTDSALQEILNLNQSQKSVDFVNLIQEQDEEMHKVLSNLVEVSIELRRTDVLKAMQNSLLENARAEIQRAKIEEKHDSWVSSLLKDGQLEEAQFENLLNNRATNQMSFFKNVLKEEEIQAEAFKLLLLKMDLKRNSVIRQIALIEYELTRMSSLELRKKRCGLKYGSTTMLHQRRTLVDMLKSLLKVKEERDDELDNWVTQLSQHKDSDLTSEDFWLLQYQKLMMLKPSGIAEAIEKLDPKIHKVLSMACAVDLIPVFAKRQITFTGFMDMMEDDYAAMDIGTATYHSIQRALHSYLVTSKVGPEKPSTSLDVCSTPTAPAMEEEEEENAVSHLFDGRASAPPLEAQYVETECVVCLNSDCRVLFMPCGHVCVCSSCCPSLATCPLCRSDILSKFYINGQ